MFAGKDGLTAKAKERPAWIALEALGNQQNVVLELEKPDPVTMALLCGRAALKLDVCHAATSLQESNGDCA